MGFYLGRVLAEEGGESRIRRRGVLAAALAAPCVLFDYPGGRRTFSFAQRTDTECLATIYRAVREKNPKASIVLVGNCRGAKSVLDFCADRPEKVKAVVLMSP